MKTVLITGGARGIGKETAKVFAVEGYRVLLHYNRSLREAQFLHGQLEEQGGEVHLLQGDFSTLDAVKAFTGEVCAQFPHIDVLINNAGMSFSGLLGDTTDQILQEIFTVNTLSAMAITREIARGMINRKSGCVLNISSIWGVVGASCEVAYSASKSALIGFTKAFAKEVAPSNVRVNCIAPGAIETDMMAQYTGEDIALLQGDIPFGRLGTPGEIAKTALFLAGEGAKYITGQTISPNGGLVI